MKGISSIAKTVTENIYRFRLTIFAAVLSGVALGAYFLLPSVVAREYQNGSNTHTDTVTATSSKDTHKDAEDSNARSVSYVDTPSQVKAVYMSACAASSANFRRQFRTLLEETELNSIVIDIKDFTGTISFPTDGSLKESNKAAEGCRVSDMRSYIKELHKQDIYVIGRITAFQDPYYAKKNPSIAIKASSTGKLWADSKGLHYIDPGAKQAWQYLTDIGRAAYRIGFDELNYDYIRYPSDGNVENMRLPISEGQQKRAVLKSFFSHLDNAFEDSDVVISADIFGMTTTNPDDLSIGQVLEDALAHFDYVAPMTYPSHYSPGFIGLSKPADHPYKVMHYSMQQAVQRIEELSWEPDFATTTAASGIATTTAVQATPTPPWQPGTARADAIEALSKTQRQAISKEQLRPWIQDFDLGAEYTPKMVRDQIQAVYDAEVDSWMLWDPSNTYTREALENATATKEALQSPTSTATTSEL